MHLRFLYHDDVFSRCKYSHHRKPVISFDALQGVDVSQMEQTRWYQLDIYKLKDYNFTLAKGLGLCTT